MSRPHDKTKPSRSQPARPKGSIDKGKTMAITMADEKGPPEFGWKVKMNHKFEESWDQNFRPRLGQIVDLLPLIVRYIIWWFVTWVIRRVKPFIDPFMLKGKQIYGVPLGGIGSGTIGRGFKGEFCRFQMTPGLYNYDVSHADQFILSVRDSAGDLLYQKVLSGAGHLGTLSAWDWSFDPSQGNYHGLYPRAWYTYNIPEQNLIVQCKQISPVIPHNYQDSCMPMAAFVWTIKNNGISPKIVSLTFTFRNGVGAKNEKGNCTSESFSVVSSSAAIKGVALHHRIRGIDVTYGVGCLEKPQQKVTRMTQFNLKTGADLWDSLSCTGQLSDDLGGSKGNEIGMAVCCRGLVQSKTSQEMVFSLTWHQPVIHFQGKMKSYTRRYVKILNHVTKNTANTQDKNVAVQNLTKYCLQNYNEWDKAISQWQSPILLDKGLPSWFKSALFNELYFISDGGTLWLAYENETLPRQIQNSKNDIRNEIGRFAYLEGHEYRMYNALQYDIAQAFHFEDTTTKIHLYDGHRSHRKQRETIPHDMGDPSEDPFLKINSYPLHDVATWRDLNLKFILQVYRDYKLTKDVTYLNDMVPICIKLMDKSIKWDQDGDGLIENSGCPDQTYDAWIMTGVSAYCGGLWLASLYAMIEMIKFTDIPLLDKDFYLKLYSDNLSRGAKSFHDKLWAGSYYKFDSKGKHGNSIMSDQLCGHWYLSMCRVDTDSIFPRENVQRALEIIFERNVMGVGDGKMGAVNGMREKKDGTFEIDYYAIQSEEIWTGVTYALAATMINQGMTQEGFKTAEGIYRTVYEKIGMGFETPEALYENKKYRAIGYMRPLSIWSIFLAFGLVKESSTK